MGTSESSQGLDPSRFDAIISAADSQLEEYARQKQLLQDVGEGMLGDSVARWAVELLGEIADELTLEVAFATHRKILLGLMCPKCTPGCGHFVPVQRPGVDLYGQKVEKTPNESFACNHCGQNVAAARFTAHLEKCMGMGRNSSRLARRRLVHPGSDSEEDDEEEEDGSYSDRSRKRRQKAPSPKRMKPTKLRPDSANSMRLSVPKLTTTKRSTPTPTAEMVRAWSEEEAKEYFTQYCGVVSAVSGKPCTKSLKCPNHDDEARRKVRLEHNLPYVAPAAATAVGGHNNNSSHTPSLLGPGLAKPPKLVRPQRLRPRTPVDDDTKHTADTASVGEVPASPNEYVDVDGDGDDASEYSAFLRSASHSPSSTRSASPASSMTGDSAKKRRKVTRKA